MKIALAALGTLIVSAVITLAANWSVSLNSTVKDQDARLRAREAEAAEHRVMLRTMNEKLDALLAAHNVRITDKKR